MHRVILLCIWLSFFTLAAQQDSTVVEVPLVVQYDEDTQVQPFDFNDATVESYKDNPDFNYNETLETETWWSKIKQWLSNVFRNFFEWLFGNGFENSWILQVLFQLLPYLFIAACIGFVIWLVYKLNPGAFALKSKEKPSVSFSEEEEIIKTQNIKELIEKALLNKDYRLAVRYYYLFILKKLTDGDLIEYEADKTNNDYFHEIKEHVLQNKFQKVSILYDYIWYGSFDVTETDYAVAKNQFEKVEQLIPSANE